MTPREQETKDAGKRARIIVILSVKGGVGKTTIASNLAVSLSTDQKCKTLLIDCDFDLPTVGIHLNMLDPDITLHDVLNNRFPFKEAIHVHRESGLDVIPGSLSEDDNIVSENLEYLIKQQSEDYDWIIIDTKLRTRPEPAQDNNHLR